MLCLTLAADGWCCAEAGDGQSSYHGNTDRITGYIILGCGKKMQDNALIIPSKQTRDGRHRYNIDFVAFVTSYDVLLQKTRP
jgi:hypothetical protein